MPFNPYFVPPELSIVSSSLLLLAGENREKFSLSSSAFDNGKAIPTIYANTGMLGGKNISPPLVWVHSPRETKSFALACIDRHPIANDWIHWLAIDIPKTATSISAGVSRTVNIPTGTQELRNSFGTVGWGGPQPPRGSGRHQYEFLLCALNVDKLNLSPDTTLAAFHKAIGGKVIATAKLMGTYER
jgi:Raf kinase inhibitor-like YbhB/YbcL family protein